METNKFSRSHQHGSRAGESGHFLKTIHLFAGLSPEELQQISRDLVKRRYRQGECLFRQGDPGEVLYILHSGQVRIYVYGLENGSETSVILCGRPGEIFGELAVIDGLPRSASALAQEETVVYWIGRDAFRDHMRRLPLLAHNFMRLLSNKVRSSTRRVNSLASSSVGSRLARLLLELAQDYGEVTDSGVRITAQLNQSDLASMIGATRESANKGLRSFQREGLIVQTSGGIVLLDPQALRDKVTSG